MSVRRWGVSAGGAQVGGCGDCRLVGGGRPPNSQLQQKAPCARLGCAHVCVSAHCDMERGKRDCLLGGRGLVRGAERIKRLTFMTLCDCDNGLRQAAERHDDREDLDAIAHHPHHEAHEPHLTALDRQHVCMQSA